MKSIRPLLILTACVSFGLGISLPLMQFETLYFFTENPSLLSIIYNLWTGNETLLAVLVSAFTLVFPLIKLYHVLQCAISNRPIKNWSAALAKWSMVDVLLVALTIFAVKTTGMASAITQPGLWFFTLSAITTALASNLPENVDAQAKA